MSESRKGLASSNYDAIRSDNKQRYGTDIPRIGPMLLADRYDDRSHFIFELLQNAEDALERRVGWRGSRTIGFVLSNNELRVSHYGNPFSEGDVRGICGIAESTKDLTSIGRFGIGFKSVYALTDRPEVHSGAENFAIESFVWPTAVPAINRHSDETVFILPLRATDATAHSEVKSGLQRLGPRILLFLRQIDDILWRIENGPSGHYRRIRSNQFAGNGRMIRLEAEKSNDGVINGEDWLVFSRKVMTPERVVAGYVEIAFALHREATSSKWFVHPITDSPLVVFFPTILETHLGCLVQGPYPGPAHQKCAVSSTLRR